MKLWWGVGGIVEKIAISIFGGKRKFSKGKDEKDEKKKKNKRNKTKQTKTNKTDRLINEPANEQNN